MTHSSLDCPGFYVDEVRFHEAQRHEYASGLLGYVSFRLNRGLRVDGVTVRRTLHGKLSLSFPARRGLTGCQFFFVRPTDSRTRQDIERQIFAALRLEVNTFP